MNVNKRVVVTGLGCISPLGNSVEENWNHLLLGKSGVGPITAFDCVDFPVKFAAEVKNFDPSKYFEHKEIKKHQKFTQYAVAAAEEAVNQSGYMISEQNSHRVGTIIGVGLGGLESIEETHAIYVEKGSRRISPFFVPGLIANMAAGVVSMRFHAKGPNWAPVSACASGSHAIGEAAVLIRRGVCDMVIAGGSESTITPLCIGGFASMKAVSTRNEDPLRASRPFDRDRDGFVVGEGSGILILESYESAQLRGAQILAELIGYGASSDAYHFTMPAPEGEGAARCMQATLEDAGISFEKVDYINAHGTSTSLNDKFETMAIKKVFGEHAKKLFVSSTKSMTGHLLGGAGGVEAVYSVKTLLHGMVPPTINYETPDPDCDLDYVPNQSREKKVHIALSNSFGFGGTNAALLFRKWE